MISELHQYTPSMGQKVKYQNKLLDMACNQWEGYDARKEIGKEFMIHQ